jgi:hypothetical protein
MSKSGSLATARLGPVSAIGPQPRRRHENEVWAGTPTAPWGSRRLPRTLLAGDPRRTLFRTLLRRAEGVPVEFADGDAGVVEKAVFSAVGFDFWPLELVVSTSKGRRRAPTALVRKIDVRSPRIVVGPVSGEPLERGEGGRDARDGGKSVRRLDRRQDRDEGGMLPRRHRKAAEAVGSR